QISDQVTRFLSDGLGSVESGVLRAACIIFYEQKQSSIPTLKTRNFFYNFVFRKNKSLRIRNIEEGLKAQTKDSKIKSDSWKLIPLPRL
ncbi:hypothetical protein IQ65_21435, partial [Leptospira interrogans serovar Lai]